MLTPFLELLKLNFPHKYTHIIPDKKTKYTAHKPQIC